MFCPPNLATNVVKMSALEGLMRRYRYEDKEKCRGTDSNCRHRHFQCRALPPELPRQGTTIIESATNAVKAKEHTPPQSSGPTRWAGSPHNADNLLT